jgi:hypothetical protein
MTTLPQPRPEQPAKLNLDVHQKQKQTQVCPALKEWEQISIPIFAIKTKSGYGRTIRILR